MRRTLPACLALLSVLTAAIHASVIREHLHEYAPFGEFFAALTITQLAAAAVLITSPSRRLLATIAAGNLAVALLWVASRTSGLPIGAEHWTAEPVQLKDAVCTAAECALAAGTLALRRRRLDDATDPTSLGVLPQLGPYWAGDEVGAS